jgi:hypothetical protein
MTSIAPLSVAGFMEFQLFETVPVMDRTYCIFPACCLKGTWTGVQSPGGLQLVGALNVDVVFRLPAKMADETDYAGLGQVLGGNA